MSQLSACTITEVRLTFIRPVAGLIALARIVLNDALVLDGIGIHQKLNGGYRLTYPTKNGRLLFHPIHDSVSKLFEQVIFSKLNEQKKVVNHDDRYCGADVAAGTIPHP